MMNSYLMIFYLFMNMMMIFIMMIPSNLYKFHPLILSIILIIYSMLMMLKLNFFFNLYWYSYIMFLVMVGGLMILFMYFTSLMNNQMFFFNNNYYLYFMMKIIILFILLIYIYSNSDMSNNLFYRNSFELNKFNNFFLIKNYFIMKNLMMDYIMDMNIYMILYLFFTMICSVLICLKISIPLRQIYKLN